MATLARVDAISDRTLSRLLKWGSVALVALVIVFALVYVRGTRVDSGPSLPDRQVTAAEEVVKANPQNVNARLTLANTYLKTGRPEDALAQYDEILRAVPGLEAAVYGSATARMQTGDIDGAKKLFTQITTTTKKTEFANVDPLLASAYYWLGKIAADAGDPKTAVTNLKASLAIEDSDADSWYLLGTLQTKSGDAAGAVISLQRAVAFVPTGWCEPYAAMGDAYKAQSKAEMVEWAGAMTAFCGGDVDGAVSRLTPLTTGPGAVPAMLSLGLISEVQSQRDAAVDWYQKALKAEPGNTTAQTALGRLGATSVSAPAKAK